MLKRLHIRNYAIIEEIEIDFSGNMNAITGETGAGKSILMGALSLILGDRADTSALLNHEKKCIVEGFFTLDTQDALRLFLAENDLTEDGGEEELVIRREISSNGKSRAFINDTPVNLEQVRRAGALLVDLHRQFDTLSLADSGFQREVIDALGGNSVLLKDYRKKFELWQAVKAELNECKLKKDAFNKEYDYHKFLFDELEEAGFKENELEEAEEELKMLSHAESIKNALEQASGELNEGEQPIVQRLKNMQRQLSAVSKYHQGAEALIKRLQSAQIELQDIADEAAHLNSQLNYDPRRIEYLNERMAAGYRLLKKHGVQTTGELLAIVQGLSGKLEEALNIDEEIALKEKEAGELGREAYALASTLSEKRRRQLAPFQEKVNRLLVQVGMPNARIKAEMQERGPDPFGKDDIEFLFDANKSGRFEPIRKVASGGELSRLMLSIKSLVAESMDLPTLIFDEIDSGISGEAAKQVGLIMSKLSARRQLITITHQPQIAGRANAHYFVYKEKKGEAIKTNIRLLTEEERITAIARMLSGEKPTAAALANAREMVMN